MDKIIKVKHWVDIPENATGIFENKQGSIFWYLNGEYHRVNGPAVIGADGSKYWYKNGKYHRVDGPAAELYNGENFWFLNGTEMSETEHEIKSRKYKTKVGRLLYKEET